MNGIWQGTKKMKWESRCPHKKYRKTGEADGERAGWGSALRLLTVKESPAAQQGCLWVAGYKRRCGPQCAADEKSEMCGVLPRGMANAVNLHGPWIEFPDCLAPA